MFGAQAASGGESSPAPPIAPNTADSPQYEIASSRPSPIPKSAPRRPVVTANGTAINVMTSATNGKAILRCSATRYGTTSKPLIRSAAM